MIMGVTSLSLEVESKDFQKNSINKVLSPEQMNSFESLRRKWVDFMIGIDSLDSIPKDVQENLIGNYNRRTEVLLKTYNSNSDRKYLWKEIGDMKDGGHIKKNFENLIVLSKAYIFPGTNVYNDSKIRDIIISSLEYLNTNGYYIGAKKNGNWWNWEIGTPKVVNEVVGYMYHHLPEDLRDRLLTTSYSFQPYAQFSGITIINGKELSSQKRVSTGGNRLDTAIIVLIRGILSKDEKQILDAVSAVPEVGELVTEGEGFYQDGSFVQHGNVAYNGTYAAVLFSGFGSILNLTKGTPYEIKDERLNNLYNTIIDGYDPLLINGRVMDMVSGRSLSRDNANDLQKGRTILNSIAVISENVNSPYKEKMKALVKENIESNPLYYLPDTISDPALKRIYGEIMKDENIVYTKKNQSKIYYSMDRAVHSRKNYSLGIAMHSDRIANFETMNGENQRGWHTSDGATYLYTQDIGQYTNFWPTVDPYHLPGTTASIKPRKNMSGERRYQFKMSPKSWVGGTGDGENSMIGMDFISWNDLTTAKKSWFLIGDVVVALGSDITSYDGEIHTTIENRKLNGDGYRVLINGEDSLEKKVLSVEKPLFFNLNNNWDGENLGYIVLMGNKVEAFETEESGSWKAIGGNSEQQIERDYFKLLINHGKNPKNEKYAYILLPMQDVKNVDTFDVENLEILKLNSNLHAVRDKKKGITGINFWKNEKITFEQITSYNPMSLLMKEEDNILNLWVSNPTQSMREDNIVEISGKYTLINQPERNVKLIEKKGKIILEIDLKQTGKTVNIQLKKI